MEYQKKQRIDDALVSKPIKKKTSRQEVAMLPKPADSTKRQFPGHKGQKTTRKGQVNDVSPPFQLQERSPSDSLPDSSASGNEYRALRRKYLLLEEESGGLARQLAEVQGEVKALEDEKEALLDELVVLEGLVDPVDVQPQGQRL